MASKIIGRERELEILDSKLASSQPEFLVVYGRRRVGKTYLIREYLQSSFVLDFSGAFEAEMDMQLDNFFSEYIRWTKGQRESAPPQNWSKVFQYIADYLYSFKKRKRKIVVFIDELPWLDTPRSNFVKALEYFWNQHGSKMNNLLLVACGSSASWIKKKLLKSKGGLHNRVTQRIHLMPFDLYECSLLCQQQKITLTQYQIIQLYLVLGGVPFYWRALTKGKSVDQLINELCFAAEGLLYDEYDQLYHSLFKNAENHIGLVEALGNAPQGLTRARLLKSSGLPDGGTFNRALNDLIDSGFIDYYRPFAKKKKDTIYRLCDQYTLFYLKFIEPNKGKNKNTWQAVKADGAFLPWSGYAFENLCFDHIDQILNGLGVRGINSKISAWKFDGDDAMPGAQVDMIIERADGIIHLSEAKYSQKEYILTKGYNEKLRQKRNIFQYATKTKKAVVTTLITTYPAIRNKYFGEEIHTEITMNQLFKPKE